MAIALTPSGASTILTATGPAMSDTFSVAAAGQYVFSATENGSFATLVFTLQSFRGFSAQTLQVWNALISSTITFTLLPGVTYRLNCTFFTGGTNVTVTASGDSIKPKAPTKIAQFQLSDWTPIVAPIDCNYYFVIQNLDGSALLRGSDPKDPKTQYEIPQGNSFALIVPVNGNSPRFHAGDTVTYLKSLSGNGPVIVEFYL